MIVKIWYKGELFATFPHGHTMELPLPDGRRLHVGPDGVYFKQEIVPKDGVQVTMA